jgi:hypothetical protein
MRTILASIVAVSTIAAVFACSSGATDTSSSSGGMKEPGCGNDQLDPGEECDSASNCYANCTCIDKTKNCPGKTSGSSSSGGGSSGGGSSSGGGTTDAGKSDAKVDASGGGSSSGGGACPAGTKVWAGKVGPERSAWGKSVGAAKIGIPFGDNLCNTTFPGSHSCEFREFARAIGRSEVPTEAGKTLWVTRQTAVEYKGIMYPDEILGGGSCDGWKYDTNHRSNGQWYDMDPKTGDESRFHLDTTPFFDPEGAPDLMTTEPGMPCGSANGGVGRFIACCNNNTEQCN